MHLPTANRFIQFQSDIPTNIGILLREMYISYMRKRSTNPLINSLLNEIHIPFGDLTNDMNDHSNRKYHHGYNINQSEKIDHNTNGDIHYSSKLN